MLRFPYIGEEGSYPIMSTPKDKAAALEIALGRIEKDHGKGAVMRLGEVASRLTTE